MPEIRKKQKHRVLQTHLCDLDPLELLFDWKSNRKAMNRNRNNQKTNPAPKTKTGNKQTSQIDKIQ